MPVVSKMNEFLENFQTAFDPPPPSLFGKNVAIFQKIMTTSTISKFFRKFKTKSAVSNAKKTCNSFFLDRKRSPPSPLGNFPKILPFLKRQASLKQRVWDDLFLRSFYCAPYSAKADSLQA